MTDEPETTAVSVLDTLTNIETLMPHRQIVYLQEWLQAQLPWRRALSQKVSERIRDAA